MKPLLILSNSAATAAVFRLPLIEAAIAHGHRVHVVCGEGVNAKDHVRTIRQLGAKVHLLPGFDSDGVAIGELRAQARAVGRVLDTVRPAIAHAFTHRAIVATYLALRTRPDIRFFPNVTGAGRLFEDRLGWLDRAKRRALLGFYRAMAGRSEVAYFQNNADAQEIGGAMKLPPHRIGVTNGSGLNPDILPAPSPEQCARFRADLARDHGIGPDKRLYLFAARGLYSKGVIEFYKAARLYLERYDDAAFLHAGAPAANPSVGWSLREIEAMRRPGIAYLGFRADIQTVLADCEGSVLPSYYREGVPRALIEALFHGQIILTTDRPGCRETVVDGWNGYRVEPRNAQSLFEALVKLRESDRATLRRNSRELFERRFHSRHVVRVYLEQYARDPWGSSQARQPGKPMWREASSAEEDTLPRGLAKR